MKKGKNKHLISQNELHRKLNFIYIFAFIFFSGCFGIISYFNLKNNSSSLILFQNPLRIIFNLSIIGFSLSGLLIGLGVFLCNGGFLYHLLCGIPSLAKESFLIVFLFSLFLALTELTKNKTMAWLFKTESFYVSYLDDSLYFTIGFLSFIFFLLIILSFVIIIDSKELKRLYTKQKGNPL
jgi:hypothetical protein